MPRATVSEGDSGPSVARVQRALGLPADGDFGPVTDEGVKAFQRAHGLAVDGVVGPMTWSALDTLNAKMLAGDTGISEGLETEIDTIADQSPLASFSWRDRGHAPPGYYAGMSKTFAVAVRRLDRDDPAAKLMAAADSHKPDTDALSWYAQEFADEGLSNATSGADTLRHLFVMLTGLGMRESSGNPFEGRDTSASNVESDTAEAGLFQSSWNLATCAVEIDQLFDEYNADPNGFLSTFDLGLEPTTKNLDSFGSGDGACYQWLAKFSPAFTTLMAGVGLRKRRQHWGPINRREVQIVAMVDDLLIDVQRAMEDEEPQVA